MVVLAAPELSKLAEKGYVDPNSQSALVNSSIGMAVPKGAPKPDISSAAKFEKVLLNAKHIGYSASASGTHLEKDVFPSFPPVEYKVMLVKQKKWSVTAWQNVLLKVSLILVSSKLVKSNLLRPIWSS